jgi:hypothetical protein
VDIEEFYDADERRRASDEVELGNDWYDANGKRFEISWVADTGELYAMREPQEPVDSDPAFGYTWVEPLDVDTVTVEMLATIPDRAELDRRFEGWQDAMAQPDGLAWVRSRLT